MTIETRQEKIFYKDEAFWICKRGQGYYFRPSRKGEIYLHRIIWEEHFGKIPKGLDVHHLNGNTIDNRIDNLALVPHAKHSRDHVKQAKISYDDAVAIRKEFSIGQVTQLKLSEKYGISKASISLIINNKIWRDHVQVA